PNVDGAIETADDAHFSDAADAFELNANCLIGEFSQFAQRTIGGERDGDYGRAVVIKLLHHRWRRILRKLASKRVDAIADVLRRRLEIAIELESSDDDSGPLP